MFENNSIYRFCYFGSPAWKNVRCVLFRLPRPVSSSLVACRADCIASSITSAAARGGGVSSVILFLRARPFLLSRGDGWFGVLKISSISVSLDFDFWREGGLLLVFLVCLVERTGSGAGSVLAVEGGLLLVSSVSSFELSGSGAGSVFAASIGSY